MDALIEGVVPSTGFCCLTTIKKGRPVQVFFESREEMVAAGIAASAIDGTNAYYAMASFREPGARTQDNVLALKSFWLDVDCKDKNPTMDYASPDEGLDAIGAFCKYHSFPRPSIVNSGFGWHVYWTLDEPITKDVWQPVANKLKTLCLTKGDGALRIDPACTADSARVLRIPNTFNYRSNPPAQVESVLVGKPVSLGAFKTLLDFACKQPEAPALVLVPPVAKKELSATTKALLSNSITSFGKIVTKCVAGTGCDQILYGIQNQADVSEPMWRGLLSIAECCTDRVQAIDYISREHPAYDSDEALTKASKTRDRTTGKGQPYTCARFNTERSGVCTACAHWGKIKSPVVLGHEIDAISEPVQVDTTPPDAPKIVEHVIKLPESPTVTPIQDTLTNEDYVQVNLQATQIALDKFNAAQKIATIPVPPSPYLRGTNGGIYKRMKVDDDGTYDNVLIYENDLYIHSRLFDPEAGQVLACRLHLPMDGIRSFNIPLGSVGSKDELRKSLAKQGVAAEDKAMTLIGSYLLTSAREMQRVTKEETSRVQMGWQEDGAFIVGNREYTKSGIRHCPPSTATASYQSKFTIEGSIAEWRKIVDFYKAPGFEPHQFIILAMMSSPLVRFSSNFGMLISMNSDESGLGKTALQRVCNSIWGHPADLMTMPKDTEKTIAHRMGVYRSMGICVDEFTAKTSKQCSDIAYLLSNGRGNARMYGHINAERENNTAWALNMLVSANASIIDRISADKAAPEAERMRLMEFDMRGSPVIDKAKADDVFNPLPKNYGMAGHILAAWLAEHIDDIPALITATQKQLDKQFKFTSKERIWSSTIAQTLTMWRIAHKLGLHDFDMPTMITYLMKFIANSRTAVKSESSTHGELLGEFLASNHGNVLVINGLRDAQGLLSPQSNRNINRIVARYEPDTKRLIVVISDLKKYCVEKQLSYEGLKVLAVKCGSMRLTTGTGVVAGGIKCLEFDAKALEMDDAAVVA